ncbi:anti-sigma-F factor Fin [Effusibacillus pohliae]|uniref:anti-sigma-F factor Fin n=1 Tax=Effusibacillus pohliae TaxID=232270 RepID=UPI00035CF7D0|nr:anti-sigma-F factor Fin [Effusibacillus pohliae]
MQFIYVCRHCRSYLGRVDHGRVDETRLGFTSLTAEEQADIITYNSDEDVAYVKTICDYCQEAIEAHPELVLLENPLQ